MIAPHAPHALPAGPWPGVAELVALVGIDAAQVALCLAIDADGSGRIEDDALAVADQVDRRSVRRLCRAGVLALRSHDEPRPRWSLQWPISVGAPRLASTRKEAAHVA